MEWLFVKKIQDIALFDELVSITKYKYPKEFKTFVLQYNGATPEADVFDTVNTRGRVFNRLLSLNKSDIETVWNCLGDDVSWSIDGLDWRYIPFANDPFGNFICFDRTNDHIVFWNHETSEVEEVADSFSEFIDSLYPFDEEEFFAKYTN